MERIFDEERMAGLTFEWQKSGDLETLNEIILGCSTYLEVLLRMRAGLRFDDYPDARQDANLKLVRVLSAFSVQKGRLFSFLSVTLKNFFYDWLKHREFIYRAMPTEEKLLHRLVDEKERGEPDYAVNLIPDLLRLYRTRFSEPEELEAQRFLLEELAASGALPRQAAFQARFAHYKWPERKSLTLYNYVRVRLRLLLCEEGIAPPGGLPSSPLASRKLEEARQLLGEELFLKLCLVFGGLDGITFPAYLGNFLSRRIYREPPEELKALPLSEKTKEGKRPRLPY